MSDSDRMRRIIALNRFGLGARPDDLSAVADAGKYLAAQLERYDPSPAVFRDMPAGGRYLRDALTAKGRSGMSSAEMDAAPDAEENVKRELRKQTDALYVRGIEARVEHALSTGTPFLERMVHFWANHFSVSAPSRQMRALVPSFETKAIRPHVLGRFADMLQASSRHAAMLVYLNQFTSVGPNSRAAQGAARSGRQRGRGLNENLAREILELHTVGVNGGYDQSDVTEFARALTGWTVDGLGPGMRRREKGDGSSFRFSSRLHEPGDRVVMGRRYRAGGEEQGAAILDDLAHRPQTARHVATKLARHFAGDDPPARMIDRLADSFMRTGGDLGALYRTIIASPEAWEARPLKFKTPWEWTISALRGLDAREPPFTNAPRVFRELGQPVWRAESPAGWGDLEAAWASPDALWRRAKMAQRLAAGTPDEIDARALAGQILPEPLAEATRQQVAQAASPEDALVILLMSPAFLRR